CTVIPLMLLSAAPDLYASRAFALPMERTAVAQQTVTGTVADANGELLQGVSIQEVGTTNGTTTDANGRFSLNVSSAKAVLAFSYVGFSGQNITVGNQSTIHVILQEDENMLDELVVVG